MQRCFLAVVYVMESNFLRLGRNQRRDARFLKLTKSFFLEEREETCLVVSGAEPAKLRSMAPAPAHPNTRVQHQLC